MRNGLSVTVAVMLLGLPCASSALSAPLPQDQSVSLTVGSGRPIHVALMDRTRIRRVGQSVVGRVAEPIFVYDRVVIPAGTLVHGHVAALRAPSRLTRLRAMWSGDFSPHNRVVLQFDSLAVLGGGDRPIATSVTGAVVHPVRSAAPPEITDQDTSTRARGIRALPHRLASAAHARVHAVIDTVRAPRKWSRARAALVAQLPYHPQYLDKDTLYTARLTSPLDFGVVVATAAAAPETRPQPGSLLTARLTTAITSNTSARGTPIAAVVTEPVFSTDRRVILPEGTHLMGEVTFAKRAHRFHHNGQLRVLFERVQMPGQTTTVPLLASIHAVETSGDDHVRVDDEGGTRVTNPKSRLVAPALSVLALHRIADREDHDQDATAIPASPEDRRGGGRALGGLIGFRLSGLVLSRVSPAVGVGLTVLGVTRTVYTNILARGKDVEFPVDTPIQLQLAPARAK